jgi:hypothetical protein
LTSSTQCTGIGLRAHGQLAGIKSQKEFSVERATVGPALVFVWAKTATILALHQHAMKIQ